jgi:hypothetical protein
MEQDWLSAQNRRGSISGVALDERVQSIPNPFSLSLSCPLPRVYWQTGKHPDLKKFPAMGVQR